MSNLIWKPGIFILLLIVLAVSCSSSEENTVDNNGSKNDSIVTDEAEIPEIEDVEMEYNYEITNTKTKKVVMMSQEEYLASGIWENPDVMIKEIPTVK